MSSAPEASPATLLRAVIPYEQIANAAGFEEGRLIGMALAVQGKETGFNALIEETKLKDGSDLALPIIDQIHAEDNAERVKRLLAVAHESGKSVLEVVMAVNADDKSALSGGLQVVALYKRGAVAEDKRATTFSRRMASRVGYGRRQNDSSGVFAGALYPSKVTENTRHRR